MKKPGNIIGFFERIIIDERMYPSHISMYVSLLQMWSMNDYQSPFRIRRKNVMKLSKIRSVATYHKCIRELYQAGFIHYRPSYNAYKGSLVQITDFENENVCGAQIFQNQKLSLHGKVPVLVPMIYDVELYFTERDLTCAEAARFYNFYNSQDWKLSNNKPMKCWQAAARVWISRLKNVQNKNQ